MPLFIVGTGLNFLQHITEEANQAIRASNSVFILLPDAASFEYVKQINPLASVFDCIHLYDNASNRIEVYDAISQLIIQKVTPYTNVTFLTYGNPLFLISAVEKIVIKAISANIKLKIIPGISSIDTILCDLKLDLGYGVTIFDSTNLINCGFDINIHLPTLIFQLANTNSTDVEHSDIDLSRLKPLCDYLLRFYPPDHKCKIVVSSKSIYDSGYITDLTVCNLLKEGAYALKDRPTLYLPPIEKV